MPKSKPAFSTIAIVIVGLVILTVGYFVSAKFVPKAMNKAVEKTITSATDTLKAVDYTKAASTEINESVQGAQSLNVIINQNQGKININGGSSLQGTVKYLGQKPIVMTDKATSGSTFTYKSSDQQGEDLALKIPSSVPTNISVGSGASIVNMSLQDSNTPKINVGVGTGEVNITFSNKYSTQASLAAGAGQLNLKVPRNAGIKVSAAQGASLNVDFGDAYQKIGDSYQTKNYDSSQVKIDLTIGQAVGGFNVDIIE